MDQTTFTVVGVVHDPYYFSYEREPASVGSGTVQVVLYAPAAAFANDTYTVNLSDGGWCRRPAEL